MRAHRGRARSPPTRTRGPRRGTRGARGRAPSGARARSRRRRGRAGRTTRRARGSRATGGAVTARNPRALLGRRHHRRRQAEHEERRRPVGQDHVLEQVGREERRERDVLERREQADRDQREAGGEAAAPPRRRRRAAPPERAHDDGVVDGGDDDRDGPLGVGLELPGIDGGHRLSPPARAAPSSGRTRRAAPSRARPARARPSRRPPCPLVWMRLAISIPRSKLTPGIVRASANATPSKVLWSSFLHDDEPRPSRSRPRPRLARLLLPDGRGDGRHGIRVYRLQFGVWHAIACLAPPSRVQNGAWPRFAAPAAAARGADLEDVARLQVEAALGREAAAVQAVRARRAVLAARGAARAVAAALGHEAQAAVGQHAVDAHHAVAAAVSAGPARPRPQRVALDPQRILALERLDRRVQRVRHRDVDGARPGPRRPAALAAAERLVVGEPRRPERDVVHRPLAVRRHGDGAARAPT